MSYPAQTSVETYSGSRRTERGRSPDVAKQSQRPTRLARIWPGLWLHALAALGAAVFGTIFGYLVVRRGYLFAGNERAMQIFLSVTVGIGLFPLFSVPLSQVRGKRRKRTSQRRTPMPLDAKGNIDTGADGPV
jgi:hypothetical protein